MADSDPLSHAFVLASVLSCLLHFVLRSKEGGWSDFSPSHCQRRDLAGVCRSHPGR